MPVGRNAFVDTYAEEMEVTLLRLEPAEVYDPAIIGIAERCGESFLIYDREAVIDQMVRHEGADYEAAVEWHEFNTFSTWLGAGTPAFMQRACVPVVDGTSES